MTADDRRRGGRRSARTRPDERKERVLHARIPESLESELRERASRLGVSVSNLVRNVLQNAFGLVDDIVADAHDVARSARDAAARDRRAEPVVLGWQPLVLEINAVCARCNAILPRGQRAYVSVLDRPGARAFRCTACTPTHPEDTTP